MDGTRQARVKPASHRRCSCAGRGVGAEYRSSAYPVRGFVPKMTLNRLLRGGNWNNNSNNCRASQRNNNTPDNINNNIGFRVVSTPRLELRQEIAAGKAKSPGTEPGLPTSSCATRAGESRRSESSSHHRDLGIQPAVVLCCSVTFAALGLVRGLRQPPICHTPVYGQKSLIFGSFLPVNRGYAFRTALSARKPAATYWSHR